MKRYKIYDEIWQEFSVILPLKKVGAIGDNRTYENVCCLRVSTSVDGMTAKAYKFNHNFLIETATKIVNEVKGVNRVTYYLALNHLVLLSGNEVTKFWEIESNKKTYRFIFISSRNSSGRYYILSNKEKEL